MAVLLINPVKGQRFPTRCVCTLLQTPGLAAPLSLWCAKGPDTIHETHEDMPRALLYFLLGLVKEPRVFPTLKPRQTLAQGGRRKSPRSALTWARSSKAANPLILACSRPQDLCIDYLLQQALPPFSLNKTATESIVR